MKKTVILLMGPTATGKTELALKLAEVYPIEIISVDSALVYKDMNIGTAKPSSNQLSIVPHHLIDIISPIETYSVANFLHDSWQAIDKICTLGKIPVLVGGTMMYYNALINGISKLPQSDPIIRAEIEDKAKKLGWEKLHEELYLIDPIAAKKIMPSDRQRITRALEVYELTNIPMTVLQQETKLNAHNDITFIPLVIIPKEREILHDRINARFERMLQNGFIDEVIGLKIKYTELTINHTSMRSVGYNQVWQYLDKQINYTELLATGCAATRQLAKRQITWLNNMKLPSGVELINLVQDSSLSFSNLFIQLCNHLDETFRN